MKVSIIIANYNTKDLLNQCLISIYQHTIDISFEIIVVDNASKDGSQIMLKNDFPEVKLIESRENLGFGKANNRGIEIAIGKYLFFLNTDTILLNNAVRLMFDFMEKNNSDGSIGAVGGLLLDINRMPSFSAGEFPTIHSEIKYLKSKIIETIFRNRNNQSYALRDNDYLDVDYLSGADLFVPKSVINEIGGFDPAFFMYYEDTDLQKRMSLAGFNRYIIKGPSIIHLGFGSFDSVWKFSYEPFVMSQRSMYIYMKEYFHGFNYILFRLVIILLRVTILFDHRFSFSQKMKAFAVVLKG